MSDYRPRFGYPERVIPQGERNALTAIGLLAAERCHIREFFRNNPGFCQLFAQSVTAHSTRGRRIDRLAVWRALVGIDTPDATVNHTFEVHLWRFNPDRVIVGMFGPLPMLLRIQSYCGRVRHLTVKYPGLCGELARRLRAKHPEESTGALDVWSTLFGFRLDPRVEPELCAYLDERGRERLSLNSERAKQRYKAKKAVAA